MNEWENIHSEVKRVDDKNENKKTVLYDCGRELFATKGYKDTSVADITQAAGYSVGTFYNYYASKDKLFLEIMEKENEELIRRNLNIIDMDEEPVKLLKQFLALNNKGMLENPILKQWYSPDVFGKIEKLYRDENMLQSMDFMYREFLNMVKGWQSKGKIRNDMSGEMIMAMFEAIIRIGYHKEEIGLKYFPELQNRLTDFVLRGLTDFAD